MENIVYLHSRHSRRPSHRLVKMKRKSISLNLNAPQILTIPLSWFKLFRLKVCKILSTHLVHIHRIHRSLYLHLLKLRHRDLNIEVYKSSKICIFKFITQSRIRDSVNSIRSLDLRIFILSFKKPLKRVRKTIKLTDKMFKFF